MHQIHRYIYSYALAVASLCRLKKIISYELWVATIKEPFAALLRTDIVLNSWNGAWKSIETQNLDCY